MVLLSVDTLFEFNVAARGLCSMDCATLCAVAPSVEVDHVLKEGAQFKFCAGFFLRACDCRAPHK